jgi:predicted TIM-barrel fold metal-dependent hydrolase
MYIIDVNTHFGRRTEYAYDLSLDALLGDLDTHSVAAALSYSLQGVHYDARVGTAETLAVARRRPHIIPVATLDLRELLDWQADIGNALKQGVRVFRFFPEVQGWSISSGFFGKVLDRLAGSGSTLIFAAGGLTSHWGHAEEIARITAGRGMPVILTDTSYQTMAEVISIMQAHPHIYVETNWLASVDAIPVMAELVGADRILYGSNAPMHPMQKALNQILETDLSDEDKVAILGGNAMRLLGIPPRVLAGRPQITSLEPAGFDEPIIDVHSHLGHWRLPDRNEHYDPSGMITRMGQFGVRRSIVSAYESMRYDMAAGNRALANAIAGHPELLGYVELNPHQLEASCEEMDRYYALPNFVGCEVELSHTVQPTGSPEVQALMAEIAKRGKPVLFMPAAAGDAPAERQLARDNPNLTIIHAHGMDVHWARIIADTPNICVEFNRSASIHHEIRDCLRVLGPTRILFGSDQTLLSLGASVGLYRDAGLNAEERRLSLHDNAARLFGLDSSSS